MHVDAALGCIAVVFEFKAVMVMRFFVCWVIGGCDGEWRETKSRTFEVDERLQCCCRLG